MSKEWHLRDEQELIEACIKGDGIAQRFLFDKYSGKMLGVCYRYCGEMEDARDAMQQGFIKIFNILNKFKFNSKLETWMTRIMINTSIDHFKKSNKYVLYEDPQKVVDLSEQSGSEYLEIDKDEDKVSTKALLEVIEELPDGYRIIFNMYAIDGTPHKEIADSLGISIGTSKSQLARARKLLQKMLKEKGIVG